jgi:hypothetical protein
MSKESKPSDKSADWLSKKNQILEMVIKLIAFSSKKPLPSWHYKPPINQETKNY